MRIASMPPYRLVPKLWLVIGLAALPAIVVLLASVALLELGADLGFAADATALDEVRLIAPFRWG